MGWGGKGAPRRGWNLRPHRPPVERGGTVAGRRKRHQTRSRRGRRSHASAGGTASLARCEPLQSRAGLSRRAACSQPGAKLLPLGCDRASELPSQPKSGPSLIGDAVRWWDWWHHQASIDHGHHLVAHELAEGAVIAKDDVSCHTVEPIEQRTAVGDGHSLALAVELRTSVNESVSSISAPPRWRKLNRKQPTQRLGFWCDWVFRSTRMTAAPGPAKGDAQALLRRAEGMCFRNRRAARSPRCPRSGARAGEASLAALARAARACPYLMPDRKVR